jgi:futalosine hydrolase
MHLLIVSATAREIQPLLEHAGLTGQFPAGTLRQALLGGHTVDFLVTGVGIPLTLLHMGLAARNGNPDLVINAGLAGSFSEEYPPGTTALVVQEAFGDLGIALKGVFHSLEVKGLNDPDLFPFRKGILDIPVPKTIDAWLPAKRLKGLTVNAVNAGIIDKSLTVYCYDPDLETMEGAAVALFCLQYSIPCVEIRTISNRTTEPDSRQWDIPGAIGKLNQVVITLLDALTSIKQIKH